MGLTRKISSMMTAGMVDFRSDKERTAAYTRTAKNEAKKSRKELEAQTRLMQERAADASVVRPTYAAPPAAPTQPAPGNASWQIRDRLNNIDRLHAQGIITAEEHTAQRAAIIAEL
ncbi:hypothetical protein SAMN05892883_1876 [Jatrophihabitans sp. GAS493]|uniref:hypothetical protein n=1 Tax=Jatrophihabitans sp. GAS493 TaxID=1907575 RepID=UPI000BB85575|nr:hypothetical protein [Jatrophihabitans sp. GAS493]SOD72486.1 hypothetical protein SAMN05892883_1876 [Jatrophihabitans sp. GAS493]